MEKLKRVFQRVWMDDDYDGLWYLAGLLVIWLGVGMVHLIGNTFS